MKKKSEKRKVMRVKYHKHVSMKGGEIIAHGMLHPLEAVHKNKKTQARHDFSIDKSSYEIITLIR